MDNYLLAIGGLGIVIAVNMLVLRSVTNRAAMKNWAIILAMSIIVLLIGGILAAPRLKDSFSDPAMPAPQSPATQLK